MWKFFAKVNMRSDTKRYLISLMSCLIIFLVVMLAIALITNIGFDEYRWPTYRLQAQAWLRGETALDKDYTSLELAIYNNAYYVSFPPVPSIPYLILIPILGNDVSGGILQKIYILLACFLVLSEIMRTKKMRSRECIAWALGLCFASAMLTIVPVGGVWFEAEILAFLFSVWAVIAVQRNGPLRACVFWALSIGCRPFTICMGPILLMLYLRDKKQRGASTGSTVRGLLPGIAAGLLIAGAYMWYNAIRFGNPFEFGHNYLPEFIRSQNGQFSLKYVPDNLQTMLIGSPIVKMDGALIQVNLFGFSMLISCPILALNIIWMISDIVKHRMTAVKWTIVVMAIINVFLLAMHRTVGGWQFGLRYALEMVPMSFVWYLESSERNRMKRYESIFLSFGFILNFVGAIILYI